MADSFVQVPPDSTGKQVDAASLPVGGQTVQRQRVVLGDNVGTATYATILSSGPAGSEGGLVVRNIPSGTQSVLGQVSLAAGTANIGTINNISATVVVSGAVSLAAGANKVGSISKISAGVVLAAGTANIGSINNISATVTVAGNLTIGGTPGTTSLTAGSSFTMIGGTDGSLARGLLMDAAGHAIISGSVALVAGTANIGSINNISATVVVSGAVSLAAGTNVIGTINNISATVVVSGAVSLATGANKIGFLGKISAGVVLAAGANNIGTINNISAAVTLAANAGTNIGIINNISAPVVLAAGTNNIGSINNISAAVVLAAGTNNIGLINNISANVKCVGTVAAGASVTTGDAPVQMGMRVGISAPAALGNAQATFGWADPYGRSVVILNHPSLYNSVSHGPVTKFCSTSAAVALVAAPGSGLCIYVTKIACTNGSATLTRADAYVTSATATPLVSLYTAASGGGFVSDYNPPLKCLSNSAINCRVKPAASKALFNVHFYVGPK